MRLQAHISAAPPKFLAEKKESIFVDNGAYK
jgi:hypothetical protein